MNKNLVKAIVQVLISILTTILTLLSGSALGLVHLAAPFSEFFRVSF